MDFWEFAEVRELCPDKDGPAAGNLSSTEGRSITVRAATESLADVNDFVTAYLEEAGASMKVNMQVELALEEAFVNIADYAYPECEGWAAVYVGPVPTGAPSAEADPAERQKLLSVVPDGDTEGIKLCIALLDSGIPYDPLEKGEPDLSLPAKDREIGGLGIYLIRKNMDDVKYTYCCGHNLLVMYKKF